MPIDQNPSPHAVKVPVDGQEVWWDFVEDNYFAYGSGVFLIWKNPQGIHERIAGVDLYPQNRIPNGETPIDHLVRNCVDTFNQAIKNRFQTTDSDPHPVDDEIYRALLTRLKFNGQEFSE